MKQKLLQQLLNFEDEAYEHFYATGCQYELDNNDDLDDIYLSYLIRENPKEEQNILNILEHIYFEQHPLPNNCSNCEHYSYAYDENECHLTSDYCFPEKHNCPYFTPN